MAYSDVVLADSPILYWRLEETSGSFTESGSLSGAISHGTGLTRNQTGIPSGGKGVLFTNSTTGQSKIGKALPFSYLNADYSTEVWVKTSKTDATIWMYAVSPFAYVNTNVTGKASYSHVDGSPVTGTTTITNGQWHQIVTTYKHSIRQAKLYVDGALEGTVTVPNTNFATNANFGLSEERSNTFAMNGTMDEFSFYNKVLTAEDVTAHYNAGISTTLNASFTAAPALATGTAPDASISAEIPVVLWVEPAEGFGEFAPGAIGVPVTVDMPVTEDVKIGNAGTANSTTLNIEWGVSTKGAVALRTPVSVPPNCPLVKAELRFYLDSSFVTSFEARRITSEWSESESTAGLTYDSKVEGGVHHDYSGGGWKVMDISGLVEKWLDGTPNYGIRLNNNREHVSSIMRSSESATNKPYVRLTYMAPVINGGFVASPATASGESTGAVVSIITEATVIPAIFSGSGEVSEPALEIDGGGNAEPGYSMSEMPGGYFQRPVELSAPFAEGSGEIVDVTVDTGFNAIITPEPFESESYFPDPDEARRDIDDPYFRRIVATTDGDDIWFRLDEREGMDVIERIGGSGLVNPNGHAKWNILPQFNINGPVGRRAVRLDGRQYIDRDVTTTLAFPHPGLINAGAEFTFETVIRTTQKDGLLYFGFDPRPETSGNYQTSLWIKDGKIGLVGPNAVGQSGTNELRGLTDIADGEWHHIVVSWGFGSSRVLDNGLRIYVDGQLDIRRRDDGGGAQRVFITPDQWFGAPAGMRESLNLPPNFVGDVMEMVYRYRMDIGMHDIQRLYYDAMGIIPIEIAPFRATGEVIDAKGRGNVKRALMLYFNTANPITAHADTRESALGFDAGTGDFEFGSLIPTPGSPGYLDANTRQHRAVFAGGYHIFYASIDVAPNGDWYRDPVTDLPRLADVDKDIDLSSFDLIMYKNFPDDGPELDRLQRIGLDPDALDRHVESLRRAIDETGISLWVSNPSLAVKLGIISTAEFISRLRESKTHPRQGLNQYNNWNDHAPVVHPFGANMAPWSARDTHMNNRERVVATVEGMTDLPGYIIDDVVVWSIFDPLDGLPFDWSLSFKERPDGLQVGDEYVEATYWRNEMGRDTERYIDGGGQYLRDMYAVPASAVLAGTAVTKLGRTHWVEGNKEVPNPYADYVGTIVLKPGDTLKGRPVESKILFTIGQDPRYAIFDDIEELAIQVVPDGVEPEYMKKWHFSTVRWLVGGGGGNVDQGAGGDSGGVVAIPNADGSFTFTTGANRRWANQILHRQYPEIPIKVPNMVLRGIRWLADRIIEGPGDRTVRATPLTGSGEVPMPAVNANRMVRVNVSGPALANGQMKAPEGYSGDIIVLVFPALGSASMTNYVRLVEAAPATGDGVMPDPGEVQAKSESITLFLNSNDSIILYLEEL